MTSSTPGQKVRGASLAGFLPIRSSRFAVHVIPRRDRNKKDEEEEYFVPLALGIEPSKSATKHRESSTSHRDEASIPSPPEQEASTSTLRLGAPFVQVRGKQKTTRRDTLVPPPEAASLLESRRVQPTASGSGLITRSSSNLAAESVQEEEEEGQEVDPETTIVPPTSSVRSKEKGKTAASSIPPPPAAWTTKQESLSPDLPDVEEVWRNPSRWATTSPSGKGKAKALLESVRSPVRESRSTLSSLSSIRSGTDLGHHFSSGDAPKSSRKRIRPGSEADRQDFRSNPRRTSAITARSLTQTALSSPSRGKRNLEGTHTKTSPRKKKKLQTATEPEPVLRTKASPAPIALPSAFNFDVHAIVIDSDEDFGIDPEDSEVEEDSLPSDYENGRDGEYIVEKVLEVRKVGKKGAGSWMYKVRWVRHVSCLTVLEAPKLNGTEGRCRKAMVRKMTPGKTTRASRTAQPIVASTPSSSLSAKRPDRSGDTPSNCHHRSLSCPISFASRGLPSQTHGRTRLRHVTILQRIDMHDSTSDEFGQVVSIHGTERLQGLTRSRQGGLLQRIIDPSVPFRLFLALANVGRKMAMRSVLLARAGRSSDEVRAEMGRTGMWILSRTCSSGVRASSGVSEHHGRP